MISAYLMGLERLDNCEELMDKTPGAGHTCLETDTWRRV
jgi:hypothetical protein